MTDAVTSTRRLPWTEGPADVELAAGAALLAGLEESAAPALFWHRFDRPALLLGSSQQPHVVDAVACAQAGLTVHRRRSGGGVVFSDTNLLTLDLALPRAHPLFMDDVTKSYRWIGEVWAEALHTLGLNARTIGIDEARSDTQALSPLLQQVCFGGLSPYEAAVGSSKLVGLAQMRRRAGTLYQCGVYLRWEPRQTANLMAISAPERALLTEQLTARVAGLADLLDRPVEVDEVITSFESALEKLTPLRLADADWNAAEQASRTSDLARYAAIKI